MKGSARQPVELIEFIIFALGFGLTMIASILAFYHMSINVEHREHTRFMIDLGEIFLGENSCVTIERGILDESKLFARPCVSIPSEYGVMIEAKDGKRYLSSSSPYSEVSIKFLTGEVDAMIFPCAIKSSNGKIESCKMIVWVR